MAGVRAATLLGVSTSLVSLVGGLGVGPLGSGPLRKSVVTALGGDSGAVPSTTRRFRWLACRRLSRCSSVLSRPALQHGGRRLARAARLAGHLELGLATRRPSRREVQPRLSGLPRPRGHPLHEQLGVAAVEGRDAFESGASQAAATLKERNQRLIDVEGS